MEQTTAGSLPSDEIDSKQTLDSIDCNFTYDTITSEKYNIHLRVLEKFSDKQQRGYFYSQGGDTVNKFLYHQDIASFALGLDSTETGVYKHLTNKVVFLILENEPKMLDYGLPVKNIKGLDYFMDHVSHPTCNTIPIDSIEDIIIESMEESNEGAIIVKRMLLERLNQAKKATRQHNL